MYVCNFIYLIKIMRTLEHKKCPEFVNSVAKTAKKK